MLIAELQQLEIYAHEIVPFLDDDAVETCLEDYFLKRNPMFDNDINHFRNLLAILFKAFLIENHAIFEAIQNPVTTFLELWQYLDKIEEKKMNLLKGKKKKRKYEPIAPAMVKRMSVFVEKLVNKTNESLNKMTQEPVAPRFVLCNLLLGEYLMNLDPEEKNIFEFDSHIQSLYSNNNDVETSDNVNVENIDDKNDDMDVDEKGTEENQETTCTDNDDNQGDTENDGKLGKADGNDTNVEEDGGEDEKVDDEDVVDKDENIPTNSTKPSTVNIEDSLTPQKKTTNDQPSSTTKDNQSSQD